MKRDFVHVIFTDFGPVTLSQETIKWLEMQAPDWQELLKNKRLRSKRAKWLRELIKRLEDAVNLHANIQWALGKKLDEF